MFRKLKFSNALHDYYSDQTTASDGLFLGPVVQKQVFAFDPLLNGALSREEVAALETDPGCDSTKFEEMKTELETLRPGYDALAAELEAFWAKESDTTSKAPETMQALLNPYPQCDEFEEKLLMLAPSDSTDQEVIQNFYTEILGFDKMVRKAKKDRRALLHVAVEVGGVNTLKALIALGIDPDSMNDEGQTALHRLGRGSWNVGVLALKFVYKFIMHNQFWKNNDNERR